MTTDERSVKFTTGCKPCLFAEFYDGQQIGCDFDRLEKYIEQGKAEQDRETGYYTIQTICNACRGEEWAEKHVGKNWEAEVENEIKIPLDFILMSIDDTSEDVKRKLPDLVKNCVNQERILPKKIIFVLRNKTLKSGDINNLLWECCDDIEYQLIRVLDFAADTHRCLDMGAHNSQSRYYATFDMNSRIPKNLIVVLNDLINNQLKFVSMVEPICGLNGMIVQTSLHRLYGGNRAMPLYEKVLDAAKIQNKMEYIYKWEDLWTHQE